MDITTGFEPVVGGSNPSGSTKSGAVLCSRRDSKAAGAPAPAGRSAEAGPKVLRIFGFVGSKNP